MKICVSLYNLWETSTNRTGWSEKNRKNTRATFAVAALLMLPVLLRP